MGDADESVEAGDDATERAGLSEVVPIRGVAEPEPALRSVLGEVLREARLDQHRTLADVADDAADGDATTTTSSSTTTTTRRGKAAV